MAGTQASGPGNNFADNGLPKYHQLWLDMTHRILQREYPVGEALPAESELSKAYGVSRITMRRALSRLQKDGVIERTRGRGSFVKKMPSGPDLSKSRFRATEIAVLTHADADQIAIDSDQWGMVIFREATRLFAHEGYHCRILPTHLRGELDISAIQASLDQIRPNLAGVLTFGRPETAVLPDMFDQMDLPWVTINPCTHAQTHNFVSGDNLGGGQRVGQAFAASGQQRCLYAGSRPGRFFASDGRFQGMLLGWMGSGRELADIHFIEVREFTRILPEELDRIMAVLHASAGKWGVFCAGDILASEIMRACIAAGLEVPGQVAVMGSTGLQLAEHTSPKMSVLEQPMQALGKAAMDLLLEMIDTGQRRLPARHIPCPLVYRESFPMVEADDS